MALILKSDKCFVSLFIDSLYNDIHRATKRVIVVFRGSQEPKDFLIDVGFFKSTPDEVKMITDRKAYLHRGFSSKFELLFILAL